jgi:hypothetical protein
LAAGAASRRPSIKPTEPRLSRHSFLGDRDEESKHFYQDVRGDVGNLAFGTLYRGDIARYRRHDPSGFAARLLSSQTAETSKEERGKGIRDREPSKKGRSGKTAIWKRPLTSLTSCQPTSVQHGHSSPAFLPLFVHVTPPGDLSFETIGEVMDDIMLRTRQFNARTRENPHDLQLWLDFAAFQQEVGRAKGGRYSARSIAEKQVSILEQALQYHSTSPQLVLALLKAAESICDEDEMEQRWLQALSHLPREFSMWDAYLVRRRSNFAEYRAQGAAEAHNNALKVFSSERPYVSEKDVVRCALSAISHLMNTGHTELAIAATRVLLEMNYFSPKGWPEEALQSMFEEFWRSGAAMLGEPGGCGWSTWLDGSFTNATATATQRGTVNHIPSGEDASHINRASSVEVWNVMVTADNGEHDAKEIEGEIEGEGEGEDEGEGEGQEYADELDKQVDAALAEAEEGMPPEKMAMWLAMEHKKNDEQWLAVREESKSEACNLEEYACVKWEEISSFALVVNDTAARVFLLRGSLHFLGLQYLINGTLNVFDECLAPFEDWKLALPIIMDEEQLSLGQCFGHDLCSMSVWKTSSAQIWARMCPQRKECLLNCILMLLKTESEAAVDGFFLRTLYLARMLIKVAFFSGLDAGEQKLSRPPLDHARALMKTLLAQFKDSTALWLAFAEMEGFQVGGSRNVAIKILTSLLSPPTCHTGELATIVLCLARLELGTLCEDVDGAPLSLKSLRKASRETVVRAARPLAWLGQVCNGGSKVGLSSFQLSLNNNEITADIVAARRGYQDQLMGLSREADPDLQKAYVSCAAAFELVSCLLVKGTGTKDADTRSMQSSNGVNSALHLYDQFLRATLSQGDVECTKRKLMASLHLERCNLAVQTVVLTDLCPNGKYASPQAVRELLLGDWLQHCFLGSVNLLCSLELGGTTSLACGES